MVDWLFVQLNDFSHDQVQFLHMGVDWLKELGFNLPRKRMYTLGYLILSDLFPGLHFLQTAYIPQTINIDLSWLSTNPSSVSRISAASLIYFACSVSLDSCHVTLRTSPPGRAQQWRISIFIRARTMSDVLSFLLARSAQSYCFPFLLSKTLQVIRSLRGNLSSSRLLKILLIMDASSGCVLAANWR